MNVKTLSTIWERSKKVVIWYQFTSIDSLLSFQRTIKALRKSKNKSVVLLVILNNKKERHNLPSLDNVYYLSLSDLTLFGKFKDEDHKLLFDQKFDLLVQESEFVSKKYLKLFKHIQANCKVTFSENEQDLFDIVLEQKTKSNKGNYKFMQEMLEKIS